MGMLCRAWTTAGRPPNPSVGQAGWNRTLAQFEVWNGVAWVALGGGGGTPDVASIPFGVQALVQDPDPAWPGGAGIVGDPATGAPYGWSLPAAQDSAVYVSLPIPSNADVTRNPLLHVQIDDQGVGSGVGFFAVEIGIEDVVCGGPITSGIRGAYAGMGPQNPPDLNSTHQCLSFNGTAPFAPGWAHVSIRRRGTADTAPGPMTVLGGTLELPVLA